ncbi:MAG: CapA family protein [Actinomycetes bacterium]
MKALRLFIPGILIAAAVLAAGELSSALLDDPAAQQRAKPVVKQITIEANGDLLIHSPVYHRALEDGGGSRYSFDAMLSRVKPIVKSADLAVCHVETPMTPAKPPSGYPIFNAPPALARAILNTGWNACDTSSNHTLDQGQSGLDETLAELDRNGIAHTGSWASAAAAAKPLILSTQGVRVAWLAYTEMTNGIPLPNPWSVKLASAPVILADAHRARQLGAQVVIVNLHAGEEYQHEPSALQLDLAQKLTASPDITALVGQHVHVVQPIRWINGKAVIFGEGNLLSNQTVNCCPEASQDGYMALLHITVNGMSARTTRVDYVPVWVRHPDFVVLPVQQAIRNHWAAVDDLRASWARTTSVVGSSPTVRPL